MNKHEFLNFVNKLIAPMMNMHSKNIAHSDIKPHNIMFKGNNLKDGKISIIDFGGAGVNNTKIKQLMMTPYFVSPDFLNNRGPKYLLKTDIYSLGALIADLLSDKYQESFK